MHPLTEFFLLEYGDQYIASAKMGGPPDSMQGIEKANQKRFVKYKIHDNPQLWDLSVLINIFYDHYEEIFSEDFPSPKAKTTLLNIKEIRNKRAHDSPINAREAYRLADYAQQFFELTQYQEIIQEFNWLRLQSLEVLFNEEKEKINHGTALTQIQQQQSYPQQNIDTQQQNVFQGNPNAVIGSQNNFIQPGMQHIQPQAVESIHYKYPGSRESSQQDKMIYNTDFILQQQQQSKHSSNGFQRDRDMKQHTSIGEFEIIS
ncbi:UNKNOWN [Stylonychia lemnae]|uniref:Swt1-like HEPN domain-containing protein n=1 Tax=Stylonychia lemnae TaxID=5949 RepID=A0A078A415_STYLE|nr:UNKNOWN [Stylonychia lemnae]|eukprot:CDW76877.1 UNKNOWN [Stylonychia lemnae]